MLPGLNRSRVLVTGGAGFIGSHLVDALVSRGAEVTILDNLSSGKIDNISHHQGNPNVKFIKGDLLNPQDIELAVNNCEIVFHLAANPDVRAGSSNPESHFNQNVMATYNLLEVLRKRVMLKLLPLPLLQPYMARLQLQHQKTMESLNPSQSTERQSLHARP